MPSVAVLAADGFETIECLTMVDVMRRGGVRATLVSIMPTREVVSSLQIPVTCTSARAAGHQTRTRNERPSR